MKKNKTSGKSALKVQQGIDQPAALNPSLSKKLHRFKKDRPSAAALLEGLRTGDRSMLARAITLVESELPEEKAIASELIRLCLPHSGNSVRLGITGVPGVGKSTFIETLGLHLIDRGKQVAVLAIDPSSARTRGSILGDKTRMESLSTHSKAFIRPSASAGSLGGVARATRESVILCEAAGFDFIVIETVGVGQSETAVAQIVDFFLLLMLAGGGDELQGIKRGIMEMADLIVINKADGDNVQRARLAKKEYENALHLFPAMPNGWTPRVLTASAVNNTGIEAVYDEVEAFVKQMKSNGWFDRHRNEQTLEVFRQSIRQGLLSAFFSDAAVEKQISDLEKQILNRSLSPYEAAQQLLEKHLPGIKK